jgi:hypothetical protein
MEENMTNLYSTVDVSRLLNVGEHRLAYAIRTGKLEGPTLKIANKRVFTEADLRRVADYFGVETPSNNRAGRRK